MDFWSNLPFAVQGAIIVVSIYFIDVAVTKTASPVDNMVWRWIKSKFLS